MVGMPCARHAVSLVLCPVHSLTLTNLFLNVYKFDLTKGSGLSSDTDFAKVERTEQ
jgi:hypothetical protein